MAPWYQYIPLQDQHSLENLGLSNIQYGTMSWGLQALLNIECTNVFFLINLWITDAEIPILSLSMLHNMPLA